MSKKIGLFGGTFNPPHQGHTNSVKQVAESMALEKVIVMPAFRSPHREKEEIIAAKHRLEMAKLAFSDLDFVEVSDFECENQGLSYTIETIKYIKDCYPNDELFLIIGSDQFEAFHFWKDFSGILDKSHLIVTSRSGKKLVENQDEISQEIQALVSTYSKTELSLTSGNKLYIIQLEDVDASSSEIRSRLRSGESVGQLLNSEVKEYIEKENLYPPLKDLLKDYAAFTAFCAQILADGKAVNIVAKDLREEEKPMEFALISSGNSRKHAMALAEQVVRQVKKEYKINPLNIDGQVEGQWIVLDYGSLMVHVFYDYTRQEYQLEKLWSESKDMELELK